MHRQLIAAVLFLFFTSCVYHRSFVATSYEPVLVKDKGDLTVSAGMRPFKYYNVEVTAMPAHHLAFRAGYGGFFGLDNFYGSLLYVKDFTKYGMYVGPTLNYQHNIISRELPGLLFTNHRRYSYDCEYMSPGLVAGMRLLGDAEDESFQLILKAQYNLTQKYEYYFFNENNPDLAASYAVKDEEQLTRRIPDFFSIEPQFVYITPLSPNFIVKAHIGFNLVQHSFRHEYQYNDAAYDPKLHDAVSNHPKYLPVNIGIGIIFRHGKAEREPRG